MILSKRYDTSEKEKCVNDLTAPYTTSMGMMITLVLFYRTYINIMFILVLLGRLYLNVFMAVLLLVAVSCREIIISFNSL